ncbi:unnamed protein product [Phytophthora lilii]|uniref:Unnamed protein product n=1 Tax=Phytophthora lilii TaxID=2077276 RepID=A0A9W6TMW3_9STRA|nr:unnamed protein product [Phytophthora lilii]
MKHVLKAYVVERVAVDMDDNFTTISSREAFTQLYRVLHVVCSPEFTVISYRRAPLEHLQPAHGAAHFAKSAIPQQVRGGQLAQRGMSPRINAPRVQNDRRRMVYSPSPARSSASVMPIARERGVAGWSEHAPSRRLDMYEMEAKRRRRVPIKSESGAVHPLEDKLFWEHTNAAAVSVSKNLALLYAFLRWAPLGFYSPFVDELTNLVQQKLLEPIAPGSKKSDKTDCFSQLLADCARAEEDARAAGAPALPFEMEKLLRVVSQTALWLFSRETRRWLRTFFRQYASSVMDKQELRACFLQFLREIEEHLNAEVFAVTALQSLTNVAEEVIAGVYSYEYFHDRRPLVRQILGGQSFAGWTLFVAQMRDTYIGATSLPRGLIASENNATFSTAYPPHNSIERSWNGEWLLDMENTQWNIGEATPSGGQGSRDVSFFSLVSLISQILHLELAIDIQGSSLRVRSMGGLAGRLDCMQVVLDEKDRVFRLFPNGVASSGGDGSGGDYIGKMRVEKPGYLVVFFETFNWAMEEGNKSYHVRACIECQPENRLSIEGDVLATTGTTTFAAEEQPYVGEMSLRIKRKSVDKANARRYHAAGASRDGPAASWSEHSRFRLNYRKL